MERKKHEIWAVLVLMLTLLMAFSLVSFHADDAQSFTDAWQRWPRNWVGPVGAVLSYRLLARLGLGAHALPLLGIWVSWCLFRWRTLSAHQGVQFLGAILTLFSVIALAAGALPAMHLLNPALPKGAGGELGQFIYDSLAERIYGIGAHVVLIGMLLVGFLLVTPFSLRGLVERTIQFCDPCFRILLRVIGRLLSSLGILLWYVGHFLISGLRTIVPMILRFLRITRHQRVPDLKKAHVAPSSVEPSASSNGHRAAVELLPPPAPLPRKRARKATTATDALFEQPDRYSLPSPKMLDSFELDDHRPDWKKLEANARILEEKLADFGVQGKVVGISPGPVITMYEYAPAPGIKISRIVGLSDDLSMALKATSIRVVAPIPGKAAIGIELPNQRRETVAIRAILESEAFTGSPAPLTIALGKDTTGQPVGANLARMPHLLIAGATGTGKSVCLNTILASLLFRNTPEDTRLLLIDPKRIELKSYENIPHLLHPVVCDAKMATRALRWAVQEMELRYRLLAEKNVRNIEGYNRALAKERPRENKAEDPSLSDSGLQHHRLPYLIIVIDELADLMMVASREVEESITRLAQMARAAGIHLILATQRPSVDVLTGIIKANIQTRISFQVSSRIDSRTILDANGAESLLGSGDMLFLPPGTAKLQRIHGAYISEAELQRITDFWRAQKLVEDNLRERVDFQNGNVSDEGSEEELDERYEEAVELVLETRQASISMLQRRLRVGYNRAARMIEMMERDGIVGPSDGVKPREVFGRKKEK